MREGGVENSEYFLPINEGANFSLHSTFLVCCKKQKQQKRKYDGCGRFCNTIYHFPCFLCGLHRVKHKNEKK